MSSARVRWSSIVMSGVLMCASALAACSDTPTEARADNPAAAISGKLTAVIFGRNDQGQLISTRASAQVDMDMTGKSEKQAPVISMQRFSPVSATDSAGWNERPTFGAKVERVSRAGKLHASFEFHAERMGKATNVNGKLVETFFVRQGGGKTGKPVGAVTQIDGRTVQYVEFEFSGSDSRKPSAARVFNVDSGLRFTSQMRVSLSDMNYVNRVAQRDIEGAQKMFGRLMRGIEGLVLPDQLHAQGVAFDHPCKTTEQSRDAAAFAYATAATLAATAAGVCAGLWFTCPAAVAAAIVAAGALAFALYMENEYLSCLQEFPPTCGMFEDNPCDGNGGGGGGPVGGGGGGGGGDTGGGGTGGGGYGTGGGFSCQYHEVSYFNPNDNIWHTDAWIECTRI